MLEALKTAPEDAEPFKRMIRWNLGAWLGQVHKPLRFIDLGGGCNWCGLSPDGKSFAAGMTVDPNAPSAYRSAFGTPSRGENSPHYPVLLPRSPSDQTVRSSLLTRTRVASGGHRAGHRTGALDDPVLTRTACKRESTSAPTVPRLLAHRYDDAGSRMAVATERPHGKRIRRARARPGVHCGCSRRQMGRCWPNRKWRGVHRSGRPASRPAHGILAEPRRSSAPLAQVSFSPDGKSLYVAAREGYKLRGISSFSGRIWSLGTGRTISSLMGDTAIGGYTPAADRLVTETENLLVVRDATGRVRGSGIPLGLQPGDFTFHPPPDGRTDPWFGRATACLRADFGGGRTGSRRAGNFDRGCTQHTVAGLQCLRSGPAAPMGRSPSGGSLMRRDEKTGLPHNRSRNGSAHRNPRGAATTPVGLSVRSRLQSRQIGRLFCHREQSTSHCDR